MRLIDADKLRFTNEWLSDESGTAAQFMMVSKADVDAAPTVDAEPVKHERWVKVLTDGVSATYKCSACGRTICWRDDGKNMTKYVTYCHCGAKMDEE